MKNTIFSFLLLSFLFVTSASAQWASHNVSISGTNITVYEYGSAKSQKAVLLAGGDGIITSQAMVDQQSAMGDAYASDDVQLIFLSIPYFQGNRNTVQKASQEVLNILDFARQVGYLKPGYTLIGGSAGSLIISSMFDFNQRYEGTGARLIDYVGRVAMVAGPHHNALIQGDFIQDLLDENSLSALTSLNEGISFSTRWSNYLEKLVQTNGLRIVINDRDYVLCSNLATYCSSAMHLVTNRWVQTLTDQLYDLSGLESYGIAKVVSAVGHYVPTSEYLDFIRN